MLISLGGASLRSYQPEDAPLLARYASDAVAALTDHAFFRLGLARLYARVFDGNVRSQRVLEKCAYQLEGRLRDAVLKDGRYADQFLYAKLRSRH